MIGETVLMVFRASICISAGGTYGRYIVVDWAYYYGMGWRGEVKI